MSYRNPSKKTLALLGSQGLETKFPITFREIFKHHKEYYVCMNKRVLPRDEYQNIGRLSIYGLEHLIRKYHRQAHKGGDDYLRQYVDKWWRDDGYADRMRPHEDDVYDNHPDLRWYLLTGSVMPPVE